MENCIPLYPSYSMYCIICIVFYALYLIHCVLCIVFYALYWYHSGWDEAGLPDCLTDYAKLWELFLNCEINLSSKLTKSTINLVENKHFLKLVWKLYGISILQCKITMCKCIVLSVFNYMHTFLCIGFYTFYSMHIILCIVFYTCIVSSVLHKLFSINSTPCKTFYAMNFMYCIICIVFFALYYAF